MRFDRTSTIAGLALTAALALTGCIRGPNGSVHVPEGGYRSNAMTVNGSVKVEDGARVGDATTVNGSVRLGDNVTARTVKTVNGGVRIGNFTKVKGDVKTVNGEIRLSSGADVSGDLATVNGALRLERVHVRGEVRTFNGNLLVGAGSHIEGGIHVQRPRKGRNVWMNRPRVVIGPDAIVEGELRFDQDVKLYVSDRAHIGPVKGVTPRYFSGEYPGDDDEATTASVGGPERSDPFERRHDGPERLGGPERP